MAYALKLLVTSGVQERYICSKLFKEEVLFEIGFYLMKLITKVQRITDFFKEIDF